MRPRSHADLVHRAPALSPSQEAIDRAWHLDDPDEETSIDTAVAPDEEPTTLRPPLFPAIDADLPHAHTRQHLLGRIPQPGPPIAPGGATPKRRMARGSSHGAGIGQNARIGKYELGDKLGRGAFGVVFTARDPSLDRDVALKVLRPTHLTNPDIFQRFLQEARATARISHPGIVTIHDCGRVETQLGATAFIAMELLTGESLTSRVTRNGRLAPDLAIEIARQIASALEAAHRVDVLHRDLKPDNIYVVPDPAMPGGERIKVLDFGLAKLGQEGHTQLQTVFGTPRYMSPEQCRSATQVDHRSDIYSLGCILFELVTGQLPFDGDVRQVIECHLRQPAPRASSWVPQLSPALDDLIADMLAKDPMQRPQTMGAVQRALHHAGSGQLPAADLVPTPVTVPARALPLPRPRSEPPERAVPRPRSEPRPWSEPLERADVPVPVDAGAPSGEVLVPAGAMAAAGEPPLAAVPRSGRRATWLGVAAVVVLLLMLATAVLVMAI